MRYDDIVVGGGHNGLTAAAYLARAGRRVLVLERSGHVGGAAVSSAVFPGVDARLSRYSYLVSLMPPQIMADLDLDVSLAPRSVESYTPVPTDPVRGILASGDADATAASFARVTGGAEDLRRSTEFGQRLVELASAIFPTLTNPLTDLDGIRSVCRDTSLLDRLVHEPLGRIIEDTVANDTVRGAMATDGLIGTFDSLTGESRRGNICFLYHVIGQGTGEWRLPVGGMGAVTQALAGAATKAGATVITAAEVTAVDPGSGTVEWRDVAGVTTTAQADTIHAGCSPDVLNRLLAASGADPIPAETDVEGSQLKVNLVVRRLPRLRDPHVDPATAFAGTFHVNEGYAQLAAAHDAASSGRIPDPLPCEIYCHTLSDRSILGPELAASEVQTLTVFGLHTPARLFREDPDGAREAALAAALRSIDSVLAEPIEDLLVTDADGMPCVEVRTPVDLERDVGLPGGNIFHRPLQWPWAEDAAEVGTWGVETPYENLLVCGSAARRGGCVSGIPGHNAAAAALGHVPGGSVRFPSQPGNMDGRG